MGGGEAGLAGAVGADVDNPEFFENEVGEGHQGEGEEGPAEFAVDFFEGFAANPLDEGGEGKNDGDNDGGGDDKIGENKPKSGSRHKIIVA